MTISQIWGLAFLALSVGVLTAGIVADARIGRRQRRLAALDAAADAARRAGEILNGSRNSRSNRRNKEESDGHDD